MKKKCLFFFFFLNSFLFSQTVNVKNIEDKNKEVYNLFEKGEYDNVLNLIDYIIDSSIELNYSKGRAYGYIHKAYYYYLKLDINMSLQYLKYAEHENYTKITPVFQSRVYDFFGQLYAKSNLHDEARKAFKNVISISHKIPSKSTGVYMECVAYVNISSLYTPLELDSVSYYSFKSYKLLIATPRRNDSLNILLSKTAASIGLLYKYNLNKDSSDYYFSKSLEYIPKNIKVNKSNKWFYKHLANIYFINNLFGKAKEYNDMYTNYVDSTNNFDEMKKAYVQRFLISDTLKTKDSYSNLKKYYKLQNKIDVINKTDNVVKNIIDDKDSQIKKKSFYLKYLLVIIIFSIISFVLIGYYARIYMKKDNFKKRKIITEKESKISELQSKVNAAFNEVVELAQNNSPNFLVRFQEVYPEFCENLIKLNSNIQNSELIFCAYLYLNLSTKDIAKYTFVTPTSVQMRKYRLRKKLCVPTNVDIYVWMKNLQ